MTAVTLDESRQYVFWLSIKVLGLLLLGIGFIVFGAVVVGGYFMTEQSDLTVLGIGSLMILSGVLTLYTTLLGIFYKLIADAVEAGIVSSRGEEVDPAPSFEFRDLLNKVR